jgi:hypothetical protein
MSTQRQISRTWPTNCPLMNLFPPRLALACALMETLAVGWGWSSPITAERLMAPTGRACAGGGFFVSSSGARTRGK